jgi:beta-glucanase (GH16 family)
MAAAPTIVRATALGAAESVPPPASAAGMTTLSLSDDFDSMSTIDVTGNAQADAGFNWYNAGAYAGPRDAYSVDNSILTIAIPAGGPAAELNTCNSHYGGLAFKYFYAESRFAWEPVDNNWPCFWGICVEHFDGSRDGGLGMELDVVEMGGRSFLRSGDPAAGVLCTLHTTGPGAPIVNKEGFEVHVPLDPRQFNIYAALWVPGRVTWYLNNRAISTFDYDNRYWDERDNHLLLALGSNGAWPGSSPPAWKMSVDWVRVWTGSRSSIRRRV